MDKSEAVSLAEFLVKWKRILKRQDYEACLRDMRRGTTRSIEMAIARRGLISKEELAELITEFKIGKFLTGKGVLSKSQYEDCLHAQRVMNEMGIHKTIDCVITEKGFIKEKQMHQLLNELQGGDERMIQGYRILRKIGEGAMGVVYQAQDLQHQEKPVAIKILYPHLAKNLNFAQRFMREAKLCLKLSHPNIVKAYEVGLSGDRYFYIMELADGENLRQILERRYRQNKDGVFKEAEAIKILKCVTAALDYATKFGLIHRDIKPDNIIITKDGKVKLCDLGLARTLKDDLSLTRTGMVVGTPYYISPEAAKGERDLDIRSDIYSLGATIYHMVTGRVPFEGDDSAVVLEKHRTAKMIPPNRLRTSLTPGFSAIVEKMMAKDRNERYQTPNELIRDLHILSTGKTPLAQYWVKGIKPPTRSTQVFRVEGGEVHPLAAKKHKSVTRPMVMSSRNSPGREREKRKSSLKGSATAPGEAREKRRSGQKAPPLSLSGHEGREHKNAAPLTKRTGKKNSGSPHHK